MVLVLASWAGTLAAEPAYRGRTLVDVLHEMQAEGLPIVFSSAVVPPELRVTVEPRSGEPRARLEAILGPLDLRAEDGPGGVILILTGARRTGILRGTVIAAERREPLAGATVSVTDLGRTAGTDARGRFAFPDLPAGEHPVSVEALGFAPVSTRVVVGDRAPTELAVALSLHPAFVTVVVTPGRRSLLAEEPGAAHTLTDEEIVLAPAIGGDVTRVVELLPGVAAAETSAAFNPRGSAARDVSFVLDGMELYDPFHLIGFQAPFSLLDANAVDSLDFYAGGFTVDRGDRHGGFLEVSTLGPAEDSGGDLEIGTLNSRFAYRAPMKAGSWLVSLRGWYPEAVFGQLQVGRGEKNLEPRFGDLYGKVVFNLSPQAQLSAHGLLVHDRIAFQETGEVVNESVDAVTRNGYGWLRLLTAASGRWTSDSRLDLGRIERRRDGVSAPDDAVNVRDDRDVTFFGLKHDSIWQISAAHALKMGGEIRRMEASYDYALVGTDGSTEVELDPEGTAAALYVAHRARAAATVTTELGLRWDRQTHTGENQLSPRFNLAWRPGEGSELRFALGAFSQSQRIHELQVEDGETGFHPAETADEAEVSFQRRVGTGLQIRLDAYYRKIDDLRPRYENLFEPIELFPETIEDRIRVAPIEARLRGIELLLQGPSGRSWLWWVSYTRSSAEDRIDDRWVPRSWDQPHALSFLLGFQRPERWSISLSGSAHTGWPSTPLVAEEQPDGSIEVVPGERNSIRFPFYHRLDLQARYGFTPRRGRLWLTLKVVNLTDRKNPCCVEDYTLLTDAAGEVRAEPEFDYWLGLTPSFSVLWSF